jgi:hypothetical protein
MSECYLLAWVRSINGTLIIDGAGLYSEGPESITYALFAEAPLTVAFFGGDSFETARKKALRFIENGNKDSVLGQICALALKSEEAKISKPKVTTLWDHLTEKKILL